MGRKTMTPMGLLVRVTRFSHLHAWKVLLGVLLLAGMLGNWAISHLGVSTDTDQMFATSLPWRQRQLAMDRDFPQFKDLLVAVVTAKTPEAADATADALVAALKPQTDFIASARRPDASPFLERAGLLFLDKPQLTALLEQTIDAQPFLGQLAADPSARGLFAALALVGMGVSRGEANISPFTPALKAFHQAMASAIAGKPEPLSWARLLGGDLAELAGPYRLVLIQPKLDYAALSPGAAATERMRAAITSLPGIRDGSTQVRITGSVALADEEFATVAEGTVTGLIAAVLMIAGWLFLAVRSWRLIVPILLTLGVGLVFTLAFAAAAVGTLNLVSVGFGILFVGIAVDFAIQFAVRCREARWEFPIAEEAIYVATLRGGAAILVAALAIAAGFLAFVPTDFAGVAELGLIAGVGMLIAFACTMGFMPAAIGVFRPKGEAAEVGFAWAAPLDRAIAWGRWGLLAVAAILIAVGVGLAPSLRFDSDPLNTKNPDTEAMRTLRELIASPLSNPYSIDIMVPDAAAVASLAAKLRALPLVAEVLSINSFVPEEQAEKRAMIADAAGILGPSLSAPGASTGVTPADIRMAALTALGAIEPALAKTSRDHPLREIVADLRGLTTSPEAVLAGVNDALTRYLPAQMERLRLALDPPEIRVADIPAEIARDWAAPDGRMRIQVLPKPEVSRDSAGLEAFVAQVRAAAPAAGGAAATVVETAGTIIRAFGMASLWALAALSLLLLVTLRRVRDVALVLAPLLLSALLTLIVVVLAGIELNFANIIALPLLLGVGVSFNIYFVVDFRMHAYQGLPPMLASAPAHGVLFSALTTASAFGSLAASAHPGTASMGLLLMISLGCTLAASFLFLPALLAVVARGRMQPSE